MIYNKILSSLSGEHMKKLEIIDGGVIPSEEIKRLALLAINEEQTSFSCGESHFKIKFVKDEDPTFLSEATMFFLVKEVGAMGEFVVYLPKLL